MFNITDPVVTLLGIPLIFDGEYSGSSVSDMSADAIVVVVVESTLSGNTNLDSSAIIVVQANADLSSDTDLVSAVVLGVQGTAAMSAVASLGVSTTIVNVAASIVVGESNLVAVTSVLFPGASVLDFQSNLVSSAILVSALESRPLIGQSELFATVFVPLKVLNLPIVEYVYTEDRLLKRYGVNSGQSLTITGTNGKIVEYQTIEEIEDADYYYGGGRRHVLTNTEVTAVQNAGFSSLITTENL